MHRDFLIAIAVGVALLALAPASGAASSGNAPRCFGRQATIVGSGAINGTEGPDVIVGSTGNDTVQERAASAGSRTRSARSSTFPRNRAPWSSA